MACKTAAQKPDSNNMQLKLEKPCQDLSGWASILTEIAEAMIAR